MPRAPLYLRILIVERQFIIRFDLQEQLEKAGYNIIHSQKPGEIGALIESGNFDAVIIEAELITAMEELHTLKKKLLDSQRPIFSQQLSPAICSY
jgi:DNA-binding NtrC family response regulator